MYRDDSRQLNAQYSDDELFAIVQNQSESRELDPAAALSELFRRYHAQVRTWCVRVLGDEASADDATQEIFVGLMPGATTYERRARFRAWLYVKTRNHCLNALRGKKREVDFGEDDWLENTLTDPHDPAAEAVAGDTARIVREVCAQVLTPVEQQVVHLRYHWRLRVKDITSHLALDNTSGARSNLATATRKIRRALIKRLGEPAARDLFREE